MDYNALQYNNIYIEQQAKIEQQKKRVCAMLSDLYKGDYKTIACNCMVDELESILQVNINAEDRMFLQSELNKLKNPPQDAPPPPKTAKELVFANAPKAAPVTTPVVTPK